jgi:hypothetical protein
MNIHRIDYRLLRSFLVVARIENFVRAAEALNITQSALSQQMKELASHFNSALFERKGRRSVLSEFGRDLLIKLEPLMGQVDEALLQSMHDDKQVVGALRRVDVLRLLQCDALCDKHDRQLARVLFGASTATNWAVLTLADIWAAPATDDVDGGREGVRATDALVGL